MKIKKNIILSLFIFIICSNFVNLTHADWQNPTNGSEVISALGDVAAYRNAHGNTVTTGNSAANLIVNLNTNTVTVTCDNGAVSTTLTLPPNEISSIINTASSLGYDEVVVAPPLPVITSSSSSHGGCSSYISSRSTFWSSCVIQGTWQTNGTILCKQTPSFSPNSSSCGSQVCTTTYTDGVASGTSCGPCTGCPGNVPRPSTPPEVKTISMSLNNSTTTCNGVYANNFDTCSVRISISGATNQNKLVTGWGTEGNLSNVVDISNQGSDRINGGGKALNFTNVTNTGPITGKGIYNLNGIKSRSPFSTTTGKISLKAGNTPLVLNNLSYSFKKPLVGILEASGDDGITWNFLPILGTLTKYKLSYNNIGNVNFIVGSYLVDNFISKIKPISSTFEIQDKSVNTDTLTTNGNLFSARINTSSEDISSLPTPGIQVENPIVSYSLGGENVKYYLSKKDLPDDSTPIKLMGDEFLGVKVIGGLQGDGKQTITGQDTNFSDISLLDIRTSIRKNAYENIKSLSSGKTTNGVKYVDGQNVTISGDQDFETLIVKNGNVIISGNTNSSGKKLGIIVLKDSYNMNGNYSESGNIFINSNVTYINALLYADGGLISSKNGTPYLSDSTTRTYTLNNQLTIKGTLFTRNTIGGAILSGGYYLLPGNTKTNDFNKAMVFDLNYLRRGNNLCDKNGNNICTDNGEYKEPTIIIYDSKMVLNPPKLFEK